MSEFAATVTASPTTCPACFEGRVRTFYEVEGVPVHQVRLVRSRDEALANDRGDIRLTYCQECGFVWNGAFDPGLMRYEEEYESTQAVSPTFNRFHERLADDLIRRFDLRGKRIVEVGCGQGEFLHMICDKGDNRGIGFDQVLRDTGGSERVRFVKDFYTEAHADLEPDFVCTKMTVEHIPDPGRFFAMLRRAVGDRPGAVVFVMIPEITRILDLGAFWDVYYEHCTYFSPGSLARAFRKADFDVLDVWCDYDNQYVLIAGRPGLTGDVPSPREEPVGALAPAVDAFAPRVNAACAAWRTKLQRLRSEGRRAVLWGGGSKGVAFLTTIGLNDVVDYAVDINPKRHGTYIAGGGQEIVGPGFLADYRPDLVIVMSPIYRKEIEAELSRLGVEAVITSIEDGPGAEALERILPS